MDHQTLKEVNGKSFFFVFPQYNHFCGHLRDLMSFSTLRGYVDSITTPHNLPPQPLLHRPTTHPHS